MATSAKKKKDSHPEEVQKMYGRRDLLKGIALAGLGAGVTGLLSGMKISEAAVDTTKPAIVSQFSQIGDASVVVFQDSNGVNYAIDKGGVTGQVGKIIASGTDAASVIQQAINAVPIVSKIFICPGIYYINSNITLRNSQDITFTGILTKYSNQFTPDTSMTTLVFNGGRIMQADTSWSTAYVKFENVAIYVSGDYTNSNAPIINLPYAIVEMQNVLLNINGYFANSTIILDCGSAGPPGITVEWKDISIIEGQKSGGGLSIAYLWYEGIIIRNVNLTIDMPNAIGNLGYVFFFAGNTYALVEGMDVYQNSTFTTSSNYFSAQFGTYVDLYLVGVELIDTNKVTYHIYVAQGQSASTINVFYTEVRLHEVGPRMIPKIGTAGANVITTAIGFPYRNKGIQTIAAGSTSVVVNHGLVTTPNKVIVTPQANVGTFWVSNITSTSFTINVVTAPSTNVNFYWEAEV